LSDVSDISGQSRFYELQVQTITYKKETCFLQPAAILINDFKSKAQWQWNAMALLVRQIL